MQLFIVDNLDLYKLRPRKHNRSPITKTAQLNNRNFFLVHVIQELLLAYWFLPTVYLATMFGWVLSTRLYKYDDDDDNDDDLL